MPSPRDHDWEFIAHYTCGEGWEICRRCELERLVCDGRTTKIRKGGETKWTLVKKEPPCPRR